jgi:hypothetical protein
MELRGDTQTLTIPATIWNMTPSSDRRDDYPELRLMTSTGLPANSEPGNEQAREPTGEELKFISMNDAKELWADRIWEMDGMTWLFNDGQCECLA